MHTASWSPIDFRLLSCIEGIECTVGVGYWAFFQPCVLGDGPGSGELRAGVPRGVSFAPVALNDGRPHEPPPRPSLQAPPGGAGGGGG